MNMSTSECSSGCESGWTTYLDQSSNSHWSRGVNVNEEGEEEEDEDEDLSMVSDASSGPRNFHEEENCLVDRGYFSYGAASVSEQVEIISKQKRIIKENRAYLDDTASSPVLSFSKKVSTNQASMEKETKGVPESHSKGKSALKKKFGFLKSSVSGKSTSEKSGALQGRKWQ